MDNTENNYQPDGNLEERKSEVLKKMKISLEKEDCIAINYWNSVLFNIKKEEKRILEEKKKKENHQEVKGEVSILRKLPDKEPQLISEYKNIKINTKNENLKTDLEKTLHTLALDDVIPNRNHAQKNFVYILQRYQQPEDLNDIKTFLNDVAAVGIKGKEFRDNINEMLELSNAREELKKDKINKQNYFDNHLEKLNKEIDLLDMQLDEANNKSNIDSDIYTKLLTAYRIKIEELDEILEETHKEKNISKQEEIERKMKYLKQKINSIEQYLNNNKEINNTSLK
ncbi:MAG: hypothetical protein IJ097_01090 [Bacilli bacterium]|nr:hypothetical protein [Bacilli bacterium]